MPVIVFDIPNLRKGSEKEPCVFLPGQSAFLNDSGAKLAFVERIKMDSRRADFQQAPDLLYSKGKARFANRFRPLLFASSRLR